MPAKLDRCVQHVMDQGKDQSSAFAICTASLKKKSEKEIKEPKKVNLNKQKIKEAAYVEISEGVLMGSSTPIATMNGSSQFTMMDIYKAKDYKPVVSSGSSLNKGK